MAYPPAEYSSAALRRCRLRQGLSWLPNPAVGSVAPEASLPEQVTTTREAQPTHTDVLNSHRSRSSVVPAPRLPRIAGIGSGNRFGSDRCSRGSRSCPNPIPARSAPIRTAKCRQPFDVRAQFPAVGMRSPWNRLNSAKTAPRRSSRASGCRNDLHRAAANRSESCAFRKGRMSNLLMASNTACINPSWAGCQGLALFDGSWSRSRNELGNSEHIRVMPVKFKMNESGPGGVPALGAFGLAARREHRQGRCSFKPRNGQTPGSHVRSGLNFRD